MIGAAFGAKFARGIFKPVARHLPEYVREDRLAEGVALVFEHYADQARRGHVVDDAVLVHACRRRACDPSRYLVRGCASRRDALDVRALLAGDVVLVALDAADDVSRADAAELDPECFLVAALDLRAWLTGLDDEDRDALAMRAAGFTFDEIGDALDCSTSAAFARCRRLGHELAERVHGP
jgi:hypothetical protein